MAKRASLIVTMVALALVAAACGRASQAEIDQALGITPTPTASAAQLATGTAAAAAAVAARTAASPGTDGQAAALGDVTRGSRQFITQCAGCHGPAGRGGDLLAPGGPGADVTLETLLPLIRQGVNHPAPPGPYPPTLISDSAIADLAAFIRSRAAP